MTDSGEHTYQGDPMGNNDDILRRGEFNAAMESQRRETRSVKDDSHEIKNMLKIMAVERREEARIQGAESQKLASLRSDVDDIKKVAIGLTISVGGLTLWNIIQKVGTR